MNDEVDRSQLPATSALPTGEVQVQMEFTAASPGTLGTCGTATLSVGGQPVGSGEIDNTGPHRFTAYAGMDMSRDNGTVVEVGYARQAPFAFTGTVKQVLFEMVPLPTPEDELAAHQAALQGRVVSGMNA